MNRMLLNRVKELEKKCHVPKKMVAIFPFGNGFKLLSDYSDLTFEEVEQLREQERNGEIYLMEIQIMKRQKQN